MHRPGPLSRKAFVLAILPILVTIALAAAATVDLSAYFGEPARTVHDIALWRSGEYLFFIGASYLSFLLLSQKRWFVASLVFGMGMAWASYYGSAMAL